MLQPPIDLQNNIRKMRWLEVCFTVVKFIKEFHQEKKQTKSCREEFTDDQKKRFVMTKDICIDAIDVRINDFKMLAQQAGLLHHAGNLLPLFSKRLFQDPLIYPYNQGCISPNMYDQLV